MGGHGPFTHGHFLGGVNCSPPPKKFLLQIRGQGPPITHLRCLPVIFWGGGELFTPLKIFIADSGSGAPKNPFKMFSRKKNFWGGVNCSPPL